MSYSYKKVEHQVHRLIPSRFPPVSLFDWAESAEELEQIAALEGMTNDRLLQEYGALNLVPAEDWISGPGSSPLMAAFTHPMPSRFTDGSYGVYYAGDSLRTAIHETKYHRERFLKASHEKPCLIQMREYTALVMKPMIDMTDEQFEPMLQPQISSYPISQDFARAHREKKEWGLYYPSVRLKHGHCVAVFRGPALSIPVQGCHLEYIWDGENITEIRQAVASTPSDIFF